MDMKIPVDWLLQGEPWVEYRTRIDLLSEPENEPHVVKSRAAMLVDPKVRALITELDEWPGPVVSNHKNASLLLHKLTFVADLGISIHDPGIKQILGLIEKYHSPEGPYQVLTNIPVHFGGSGKDQMSWALCDAPLLVYALNKLGGDEVDTNQALSYLAGLCRSNGWPCAASSELGKFRGPGRKEDPCPYANLVMLKALSANPKFKDDAVCHTGAETILSLWNESLTQHPYLFHMGTDFRKLKAPLIWCDLLHVLDVLTQFPWFKDDIRLRGMLDVLRSKSNSEGQFSAESIWTTWKEWEFGQKKVPSRWLTLLAWRVLNREKVA